MRLRAAHPVALGLVGVAAVLHPAPSHADDLTVAFRNAVLLPSTAVDQNGQTFSITGLSGLTFAGPAEPPAEGAWRFWAVLDNADTLVELRVVLSASGSITSVSVVRGLRLSALRDHEDIALAPGGVSVFIAEENTPRVHEHRLSDGTLVRSLDTPPVFLNRRENFGFEALTLRTVAVPGCAPDRELWTANEEALNVDGPLSTPSSGTVVRLLRSCVPVEHAVPPGPPGTQLAYVTEPIHAGPVSGARSGLVALVALPSGRTIALERSFGFDLFAPFRSRMFEIDFAAGTDVATFTEGLVGQTYTPVSKRPLFQGGQTNMEGLALGPALAGGGRSLLGIVDDADPISLNRLVAFVVTGPTEAPCPPDFDGNGVVNSTDVSAFITAWFTDLAAGSHVTDWTGDGVINSTDVSEFINAYFSVEPACLG